MLVLCLKYFRAVKLEGAECILVCLALLHVYVYFDVCMTSAPSHYMEDSLFGQATSFVYCYLSNLIHFVLFIVCLFDPYPPLGFCIPS